MSIGNTLTQGNQGKNTPYQLGSLQALGLLIDAVINLPPSGGFATEVTLLQVLSAIQNGSEFEAKLVVDAANVTWLEVRVWNTATGTWDPPLYYLPGSNIPGAPTLPINYVNPSTLLATIAANTTGVSTAVNQSTQITLATDALGGQGTDYIYVSTGAVSGKTYKYLVVNEDCTFTTLTGSSTVNLLSALPAGLGITTNKATKGMIVKGKNGETITAVTLATGSVVGVN